MSPSSVVRRAPLAQRADHLDDARDRLDRADVVLGREHAQRRHVLAEQLRLALGERHPVLAGRLRALEQRVVDVGDVLHVADVEPGVATDPLDDVEHQVRRGVAEVGGVVRRDAADVHAHDAVAAADLDQLTAGGVGHPRRTAAAQPDGGQVRNVG